LGFRAVRVPTVCVGKPLRKAVLAAGEAFEFTLHDFESKATPTTKPTPTRGQHSRANSALSVARLGRCASLLGLPAGLPAVALASRLLRPGAFYREGGSEAEGNPHPRMRRGALHIKPPKAPTFWADLGGFVHLNRRRFLRSLGASPRTIFVSHRDIQQQLQFRQR
jgi:hypothetical protein